MKSFRINNLRIGKNSRTFIVAEIGINHDGNFSRCMQMIKKAAKSGADAVKIQTVNEDESYKKKTKSYKEFKNKNFSDEQIKKLIKLSRKLKIIFFSTPGDLTSLQRLFDLKIPIIKISSGLSNNFPLIREIIKRKVPMIISTGFSGKKELIELKKFLKKYKFKKIAILKCSSKYPLPYNEVNMENFSQINKLYKYPVGYSDHTIGITTPLVAVANGASIIEKHFTLNRKKNGADHKISLEPKEFYEMVIKIREIEKIKGSKTLHLPKELRKNKRKFQRVLVAKNEIKKGEKFTLKNIKFVRVEKSLGKKPNYFFKLENKKSSKNFKKDQII